MQNNAYLQEIFARTFIAFCLNARIFPLHSDDFEILLACEISIRLSQHSDLFIYLRLIRNVCYFLFRFCSSFSDNTVIWHHRNISFVFDIKIANEYLFLLLHALGNMKTIKIGDNICNSWFGACFASPEICRNENGCLSIRHHLIRTHILFVDFSLSLSVCAICVFFQPVNHCCFRQI